MPSLLSASLIWTTLDPAQPPVIPPQLLPASVGKIAAAGQFIGTPRELLTEIAGRCCYDSFGKGRNSIDFHKHILEVGHFSVFEHAVFTVDVACTQGMMHEFILDCLNRPALWVRPEFGYRDGFLRITANLRHALEWGPSVLGHILRHHAHLLAPNIVPLSEMPGWAFRDTRVVAPETENEIWATLFLTGSRGMSHELVRHGDWTAISQRSTRYVDESASPWVEHPLVCEMATKVSTDIFQEVVANGHTGGGSTGGDLQRRAAADYGTLTDELERLLIARGVDKTTARKQARGAARGYLGNALYTEVVFSASLAQWKHMLRMRASAPADAEIRAVFCQAFAVLRERFPGTFGIWRLEPSPDGIGEIVMEGTP